MGPARGPCQGWVSRESGILVTYNVIGADMACILKLFLSLHFVDNSISCSHFFQ